MRKPGEFTRSGVGMLANAFPRHRRRRRPFYVPPAVSAVELTVEEAEQRLTGGFDPHEPGSPESD